VAKRQTLKTLTVQINMLTKQIGAANAEIKQKRTLRQQEDTRPQFGGGKNQEVEVIDEEEFRLIQTSKKLKREYTAIFEQRSLLLEQVNVLKQQTDEAKLQLASAFLKANHDEPFFDETLSRSLQGQLPPLDTTKRVDSGGPRARDLGMGLGVGLGLGLGLGSQKEDEVLDVGEQFEQLELQRIMSEHPDSLSFYNARKSMKKQKRLQGSRKPVGNQRPRMRV